MALVCGRRERDEGVWFVDVRCTRFVVCKSEYGVVGLRFELLGWIGWGMYFVVQGGGSRGCQAASGVGASST